MDGGTYDLFSKAATALLLATLPIASLVMAHNVFTWRSHPAARQKRPVLFFTSALAFLAAVTATLAVAAPQRDMPIVAPTDRGAPFAYETFALSSSAVGVATVLFGAAALGMDGLFTLHLYRVGYKLEYGAELPRWKVRGMPVVVVWWCAVDGSKAQTSQYVPPRIDMYVYIHIRHHHHRTHRFTSRTSTSGSSSSSRGSCCSRRRRYVVRACL